MSRSPVIVLYRAGRAMARSFALELAGHIAYTALLAVFPFLIFLAALAGFVGSGAESLAAVDNAVRLLPEDVAKTLLPVIREVLSSRDSGLLTLGLLGALWVASNCIDALRIALNVAYGFDKPRPWWQVKLSSLGAIVIGAGVFLVLSVLLVLGPVIWRGLLWLLPLSELDRWLFGLARYGVAGLTLLVTLMALHRWLPGRRLAWKALVPGVLVTGLLWLGTASLFSFYVANLGNYTATYGSLGGVIVTLVFFYISAALFIFGAEVNAALLRRERRKKPARHES